MHGVENKRTIVEAVVGNERFKGGDGHNVKKLLHARLKFKSTLAERMKAEVENGHY